MESNEKKQMVNDINDIRNDIQNIFFDLKKFKNFDIANQSQKTLIDLLIAISKIQREILASEIPTTPEKDENNKQWKTGLIATKKNKNY